MCQLCVQGLISPTAHHAGWTGGSSGGGTTASGKISLSYDYAADRIADYGWSGASSHAITYAFRSTNASDAGFERFDASLIEATEKALALWSDVADITFERIGSGTGASAYSNQATMLFSGDTNSGGYGWAYLPGSESASALEGDVFLNTSGTNFTDLSLGSYEFLALVHEIGHAIGLNHPGAYNGGNPTYSASAEYREDSRQYTVMSYFAAENTGAVHGYNFAATPLLHDIAAAQALYGANWATRAGDTVYGWNSTANRDSFSITATTQKVVFAIWDGGGNDTLDMSGYWQTSRIDLNEMAFSNVGGLTKNVAIARGAVIENAVGGSGIDAIIGNAVDNILTGGLGNDNLDGRGGNDSLLGGDGLDALLGGAGEDLLIGGVGNDRLSGGADADTGWGGEGNDNLDGGSGNDVLQGENGDDLLSGGDGDDQLFGGAGKDVMRGGGGNDAFVGEAGDDTVDGGLGYDTLDYSTSTGPVQVNLTTRIATGIETGKDTLINIERVIGTSGDDRFHGNAAANSLSGGDGADWMRGGVGADTMTGGAGADTYHWLTADIARVNTVSSFDRITDFDAAEDVLDLFSVVGALGRVSLSGVVQFVDRADGTMVQAKVGTSFKDVVLLEGVHGVDANAMLAEGHLMA